MCNEASKGSFTFEHLSQPYMKLSSMTIQITSRNLKIRRCNSRVLCNRIETSYEIECDDVQQEVEVRIVTPVRKKRRRQLTQILCHCCFVVMRIPYTASNNKISLSVYGKYLVMNLDCDGTRQVVQVSCSFAAFGGSC